MGRWTSFDQPTPRLATVLHCGPFRQCRGGRSAPGVDAGRSQRI